MNTPQPPVAPAGSARLYRREADYAGATLDLDPEVLDRLGTLLREIYGHDEAVELSCEVYRVLLEHESHKTAELRVWEREAASRERFTERDAILITYGDLLVSEDATPLQTLIRFSRQHLRGLVSTLHILPFFPWSSDRGFSVRSYWLVDRMLGTWQDIQELDDDFRLMFDAVFNHVSRGSRWFQEYRANHPDFRDFFIEFDRPDAIADDDLKKILRPRTSPLLTPVEGLRGRRWVWTTFSEDQVDLNFANPRVLLEILRLLLYYVRRGAQLVRLDAVTYLWKELGTSCAHHAKTHAVIRLLRAALDAVAPHVALVTETNVPHAENVAYFGDGRSEAQMVYNFALPPLVLHTFLTGNATRLVGWARELDPPSPTTHFLNFLASHDGIGLMGARGILEPAEIDALCTATVARGGLVSMRSDPETGESPYELNITWFSALNPPEASEPVRLQVDRFIASRAVALVLRGVPGIYLLSLFGRQNDRGAVLGHDSRRAINRSAVDEGLLRQLLADERGSTRRVWDRFMALLAVRREWRAFHPRSRQEVLDVGPEVFAVVRVPDEGEAILCLINVTDGPVAVDLMGTGWSLAPGARDLVQSAAEVEVRAGGDGPGTTGTVDLAPYQVAWFAGVEAAVAP